MKCYPHNDYYRADEEDVVSKLLIATRPSKQDRLEVFNQANELQAKINDKHYLTKIMQSYEMSAPEGMALMTLCEALLRTPDKQTQDNLIKDKLFFLFNILITLINGNMPNKYPILGVIKYPNDPPSKNIGKKNKPINI